VRMVEVRRLCVRERGEFFNVVVYYVCSVVLWDCCGQLGGICLC